tara:strand:- start:6157 stop:7224 length:1068 start_codon:yes stop_codon:yes gene_type:complete
MTFFNLKNILIYIITFSAFLFIINFFFKKFFFCLDLSPKKKSNHKKLLSNENVAVPLSGSFYFFLIFFAALLFFNLEIDIFLISSFFLFLGFSSDIRYINSPKVRIAIQILIAITYLSFNDKLNVEVQIQIIDFFLGYELFRIFFISFLLLILVNGFNFIDGTNLLASLNLLIISLFLIFISNGSNNISLNENLVFIFLSIFVFCIYNFFGKNFLGDGGSYGLAIFFGLLIISEITKYKWISPYFVVNLLFYPAFENFFTIIRRIFNQNKKFLPDNEHLHHLFFKFLQNKKFFHKKYLNSSFTGIFLNLYFFWSITIAYNYISYTKVQIVIITCNIVMYLITYLLLAKYLRKNSI